MAQVYHTDALEIHPSYVRVSFRFQINGTSDPDNIMPGNNLISDIARSSAGVFTITLAEALPVYIGHNGSVMGDSGVTLGLVIQGSDPADYDTGTGVLTVRVIDPYTDASPGAVDPVDDDWVYIDALFANSSFLAASRAI